MEGEGISPLPPVVGRPKPPVGAGRRPPARKGAAKTPFALDDDEAEEVDNKETPKGNLMKMGVRLIGMSGIVHGRERLKPLGNEPEAARQDERIEELNKPKSRRVSGGRLAPGEDVAKGRDRESPREARREREKEELSSSFKEKEREQLKQRYEELKKRQEDGHSAPKGARGDDIAEQEAQKRLIMEKRLQEAEQGAKKERLEELNRRYEELKRRQEEATAPKGAQDDDSAEKEARLKRLILEKRLQDLRKRKEETEKEAKKERLEELKRKQAARDRQDLLVLKRRLHEELPEEKSSSIDEDSEREKEMEKLRAEHKELKAALRHQLKEQDAMRNLLEKMQEQNRQKEKEERMEQIAVLKQRLAEKQQREKEQKALRLRKELEMRELQAALQKKREEEKERIVKKLQKKIEAEDQKRHMEEQIRIKQMILLKKQILEKEKELGRVQELEEEIAFLEEDGSAPIRKLDVAPPADFWNTAVDGWLEEEECSVFSCAPVTEAQLLTFIQDEPKLSALPEGRERVRIRALPFAKGGERYATRLIRQDGSQWVMKEYISLYKNRNVGNSLVALKGISICNSIAQSMNVMNTEGKKTLRFIAPFLIRRDSKHPVTYHLVEPFLPGEYIKFNGNNGYVRTRDIVKRGGKDVAVIGDVGRTAQAFSHFSWIHTGTKVLVVDIQGIRSGREYALTDPALHSSLTLPYDFGATDLQEKGVEEFFKSHMCNVICNRLRLPRHALQPSGYDSNDTIL